MSVPCSNQLKNCTFRHLSQRNGSLFLHKNLCTNVYDSFICNSQKLESTQCTSIGEWLKQLWYIHTMEYYSGTEGNVSLIYAWMDLQTILLGKKNPISTAYVHTVSFHLCNILEMAIKETASGRG